MAAAAQANGRPSLAVIGGTGALGGALAGRWAAAGFPVIVGSRDPARALTAAASIPGARGMANAAAAAAAEVVVVTVPFASHRAILETIREGCAGKLVIDTTVPLVPPKVATVRLPPEGSAAMAAQAILGPRATVVSAFHNVAAAKLAAGGAIDCDVLVCGDDPTARARVIALGAAIGLRCLHAGPLANAAAPEALTSVLIGINRRYRVAGAGIRITGLAEGAPS